MNRSILLLPALVFCGLAQAQTFPPHPTEGWVYDGAHLINPSDTATINRLSNDFNRDTGAPIVVATLPSLESVGAQNIGIETYSTRLFNAWHIGHAAEGKNGGILLVVAKTDHKVRIELGKDWAHDYDAGAKAINQGTILPAFKAGDFGGGIVRGCQALAGLANGTSAAATSTSNGDPSTPPAVTSSPTEAAVGGDSIFMFLFLIFAVLIVVLVFAARAIRRSRPYAGYVNPGSFDGIPMPNGRVYGGTPPIYTTAPNDDDAFLAGVVAGQVMSPPVYDPGPVFDPGPAFDSSSSFDSSPSVDTGSSFDSSSSFDSGSSDGGGDSGSW